MVDAGASDILEREMAKPLQYVVNRDVAVSQVLQDGAQFSCFHDQTPTRRMENKVDKIPSIRREAK